MNGNGYFIWLLNRIGDLNVAAEKAANAGVSWVALKIADSISPFNVFKDKGDMLGLAVEAFRRRNVKVWGWHYVYGFDPVGEAKMAESRMKNFALDGYIIDAEAEYKNKPTQAGIYMKELRHRLTVPLAICAYRFPHLHPEFPWKQFLTADINMPQVYWMQAQNAGAQLVNSYNEYAKLAKIPFVPVGAAFSEWGWTPTVKSINDFRYAAASLGLSGYSWWEWYDATTRNPDLFAASTQGSVTPVEVKRRVKTAYNDLRCRSEPSTAGKIIGYLERNKFYTSTKTSGPWFSIDELGGWAHSGYLTMV
jgi:hypothetical protein